MEGALEQIRNGEPNRLNWRGVGWRRHLRAPSIAAIGIPALGDRSLDRHVAPADVTASEGVPTHKQEVENQNGEAERIVIGRAASGAQRSAEKLRRHE